jgi:hypothetical protein
MIKGEPRKVLVEALAVLIALDELDRLDPRAKENDYFKKLEEAADQLKAIPILQPVK